jgi:hypothetical protein
MIQCTVDVLTCREVLQALTLLVSSNGINALTAKRTGPDGTRQAYITSEMLISLAHAYDLPRADAQYHGPTMPVPELRAFLDPNSLYRWKTELL